MSRKRKSLGLFYEGVFQGHHSEQTLTVTRLPVPVTLAKKQPAVYSKMDACMHGTVYMILT